MKNISTSQFLVIPNIKAKPSVNLINLCKTPYKIIWNIDKYKFGNLQADQRKGARTRSFEFGCYVSDR